MAVYQGTFIVFLLLAVSLTKSSPFTITAGKATPEDYRLDVNVVPETYALDLTLGNDFTTEKSFKGFVTISIKTKAEISDKLVLNAKDIKLDPTTKPFLYETGSTENLLEVDKEVVEETLQRITFTLKQPLAADKNYKLEITYTGELHDDMYGFYLSSYKENEGTKWIATTQFQPTHARRAFPCFDEPNFKATFAISITYPKQYRVLGNTHATSTEELTDAKKTTFAITPTMSTYLIAFVVSQFAGISRLDNDLDNINHAVWSQKQLIDTTTYSLDIAPKILEAMRGFTNIPYSTSKLTKLDQIAIPDFSAGAMENWGLVTYRESALLWDKAESTAKSKQRVASVVAHELAHMWFGNLITTDWWSSTWLNEGFARYCEYHATAEVEEDWELAHQFVLEQHQSILNSDALSTTKPLTSEDVFTPEEISGKFDSITYNKGASVIRMMEHFMGKTKFLEGIKLYTSNNDQNKHHFGNVKPEDLWNAMKTPANIPLPTDDVTLDDVMNAWTTNPGFPVVTVTTSDKKVVLEAQRFFFHKPTETSTDSVWYIPITYTTSAEKAFDNTLPGKWIKLKEKLDIDFTLTDDSWIIVNLQSSAYIRVNYGEDLWKAIQAGLQKKHDDIHVLNRAQIVDDSLNLARAGMITYNLAFDVVQYLEKETSYYPWYSAFNAFSYLRRRINNEDDLGKYLNTHISNLMQELYKSSAFNDKSTKQVDIHKKVLTQSWACQLGNAECVENAQEAFALLKENDTPVKPDLRGVVYCTAMRNSEGEENWNFLWDRFTKTNMATEANTIISALGCTKDTALLKAYLEKSITADSGIRKQDAQSVFSAVISGNHEGVQVGLDFVETKYAEIEKYYGGLNALSGVITSLADSLTTADQVTQFKTFVETADLGAAQDSADSAIERCEENLEWVKTFYDSLLAYLKEKVDGQTTTAPPGGDGAASVTVSSAVLLLSIFAILNKW